MGFLNLFRPKWQNSDPEVRLAAVRALDDNETDALEKVARTDEDVRVRRTAIKRLASPELLAEIARSDGDDGLRRLAGEMASRAFVERAAAGDQDALSRLEKSEEIVEVARTAKDEAARRAALGRLRDADALLEVAKGAKDAATRDAALALITGEEKLTEIAIADTTKEIAMAVLPRIQRAASLEAIFKSARAKAVRKVARDRLDLLNQTARPSAPPEPPVEALRHARQVQLVKTVEALQSRNDWAQLLADLAEAEAAWSDLGPGSDEPAMAERFAAATRKVREREQLRRAATETKRQRLHQEEQERKEAEERKAREAEERRLAEEARRAQSDAGEKERAARAEEKRLADEARAEEKRRQQEARAEEKRHAGEEAQRIEQENQARAEEVCAKAEKLVEATDAKAAEREIRELQTQFSGITPLPRGQGGALRDRFQAARDKAVARVRELIEAKDWERWANTAKLEKLCERVEALKEPKEGEDLKLLAQELRAAQADWKKAGPAPKDKSAALWQRFKGACDLVYARCQEHFAALEAERGENLRKKTELCEKVEAAVAEVAQAAEASDGRKPDWKAAADLIKQAQADWKAIGQVPKAEADSLWKRFRAACDGFFDRRKSHFGQQDEARSANLKRKEELCQEAEAVARSSDVREAIKVIKQLQADWKTVGIVPKAQADEVWKRFRAACDQVYEKLREGRPADEKREEQGRPEDSLQVQGEWKPATLADLIRSISGPGPGGDKA